MKSRRSFRTARLSFRPSKRKPKKKMTNLLSRNLALAALLLCVACGRGTRESGMSSQSIASPSVYVVALDTSTSAKEIHEQRYNRALQNMEAMPRSARLVVGRFDSGPAGVYDG